MPKNDTGYTPTGRNKTNPTSKMSIPDKAPSIKSPSLPMPMSGGKNNVASMPGQRFPKLTKPTVLAPRTPRI